jgi:D-alanyl-D-alanine dipeptidase
MLLLHSFRNKITKALIIIICVTPVFILCASSLNAQGQPLNKYGLEVTSDTRQLKKLITTDADNAMLDVKKVIPAVITDIKYCSNQNFMTQPLYPHISTTYLRKPAAMALAIVQKKLLQKGLGLKIWDAYRPYSVTEKMWEVVKDDRYAADPKFGSGHNRGAAVDITIVNLVTKEELNMGTGFDNFSDTAHINFKNLPQEVLQNRQLLQQLMQENGFKVLETEWWHFYLPDAKKYGLLNVSFRQLKKLNKASLN